MSALAAPNFQIFAEYLPKLSIVSLYLTFPNPPDNTNISVNDNKITIPALDDYTFSLQGVELQSESQNQPISCRSDSFNYRLITKPPIGSSGSSNVEIIQRETNLEDDGLKYMMKHSINPNILPENTEFKVNCRACSKSLGQNIKFKKVRSLPAMNWDERANELWYCHPPHPDGHCDGKKNDTQNDGGGGIVESLTEMKISTTKVLQRSIFEILNCPDVTHCYYSSCYWAVNSRILQNYKIEIFNDSDIRNKIVCCNCRQELGIKFSDDCIHLWDFGVKWTKQEEETESQVEKDDCNIKALENFKRSVFANIYEWTYSPTCQFIVRPHSQEKFAFFWNIDRNLNIYHSSLSSNDCQFIEVEKVAKFMFIEVCHGQSESINPIECKLIREAEKNESQILVLPDAVYESGLKYMKEVSAIYLTPENCFRCGFLTYKS